MNSHGLNYGYPLFYRILQFTYSMGESWETQALREHTVTLEQALLSDTKFVATALNIAALLSDDELYKINAVSSRLDDSQKAVTIVFTVKRMVKLNSENFEKFVDILKKKPQTFKTIIKLLSRPSSPDQEEVDGERI